jgi:hypothetical protein
MAESIPLRIQRDEVRLLENALEEPWQKDHRQAMRAWEFEFIVGKCLQFPKTAELDWRITCREAVLGESGDPVKRVDYVRERYDELIRVARLARERAKDFARTTGHTIKGLEGLDAVSQKLERLRDKYLFRLSLIDDQVIAEAREEHAPGDFPTPGDALADLLAARHAAQITPSYAELRDWADRSPPAPSWLEEEDPA